jgi:UDPglucose--hexose-1-phosphate uridylyltransferase
MALNFPHRRRNPLNGDWVLVSPHRTQRPWLGQVEESPSDVRPHYDPECYLCPGNSRAGGLRNPDYKGTFVFDNDFAALVPEPPAGRLPPPAPLMDYHPELGICRVICFSPRHNLTLPEMSQSEVKAVVEAWVEQAEDLGHREFIQYVQIFENKGSAMGASNPHPHSQVWASSIVPAEPAAELACQSTYLKTHGRCLLCDYIDAENAAGERITLANEHCTVVVPFWATWPFETLLLFRRHMASLTELTRVERAGLADILRRLTTRYDNLFGTPFPYSMGFHQAPCDGRDYPAWHLHAHFYPPLLRSATVRKFMVGYELLAMPQRDLTPEAAAERLRAQSERHFRS